MPLRRSVEPVVNLVDARTFLREQEPSTMDMMLEPDDPASYAEWNTEALALAKTFNLVAVQQGLWVLTSSVVWRLVFR